VISEQAKVRLSGVDPYILAGYAALFVMINLAWEFARIPVATGARGSLAYSAISRMITMGDGGIALFAVLGRRQLESRRARQWLCGLAFLVSALSVAQVFACVVWPGPGESWAEHLLDHSNGGLLGSGILCLLALVSRGRRRSEASG
jgi:hypothetical protein